MQTLKGIATSDVRRGSSSSAEHTMAKSGLVRIAWHELEPAPGDIRWQLIDDQRSVMAVQGKPWALAILAGTLAPQWVTDAATSTYSITFRTLDYRVAAPWDTAYQQHLTRLLTAVYARYKNDPLWRLLYVPQQTSNGVEGHFNGNSAAHLRRKGITEDRWVDTSCDIVRLVATACPTVPLAFEVHEVLDSAAVPQRILTQMTKEFPDGQFGAAMWWLSGKDTVYPALLSVIKAYAGPKYAQCIGRSDDKWRFGNADFRTVFAQAVTLGVQYIEVWPYDLQKNTFPKEYDAFNARVRYSTAG